MSSSTAWAFSSSEHRRVVEASQWHAPLSEDTTPIDPPDEPGWHLSEAMADRCIEWISSHRAAAPNRPFFAYWAPGCAHAPHHVATEWADSYAGAFDHGWDEQRRITHERQKALDVVPEDSELSPRPESIRAWSDCTDTSAASTPACRRSSPASSSTATPRSAGSSTLRLGETQIGHGTFDKQVPFRLTVNESLDIGCDTITPVSDLYGSPAAFTGTLHRVLIDVTGQELDDLATRVRIAMAVQ